MRMNEFRRLAAKMDQHMQQLAAQGVNDAPAIIHRMMGCVPDPHKIWVGTADHQLMALSNEFPGAGDDGPDPVVRRPSRAARDGIS